MAKYYYSDFWQKIEQALDSGKFELSEEQINSFLAESDKLPDRIILPLNQNTKSFIRQANRSLEIDFGNVDSLCENPIEFNPHSVEVEPKDPYYHNALLDTNAVFLGEGIQLYCRDAHIMVQELVMVTKIGSLILKKQQEQLVYLEEMLDVYQKKEDEKVCSDLKRFNGDEPVDDNEEEFVDLDSKKGKEVAEEPDFEADSDEVVVSEEPETDDFEEETFEEKKKKLDAQKSLEKLFKRKKADVVLEE